MSSPCKKNSLLILIGEEMFTNIRSKISKNQTVTMTAILIIMIIVSMIASPYFRTFRNFMNLFGQNSIYGVMALGMACCILVGFIDLSVGSILALAGVLSAIVLTRVGLIPGILTGIATGLVVGLANGLLVAKAKIGYFITTLGMMSICRGAVYIITNGKPISGVPTQYNVIGMGRILGIPVLAIIWIVCAVILGLIIHFTRLGRNFYATGGNERAAWLSGVNTDKIKITAFVLNGFFSGLAALMLVFKVLMATADAGTGYEMNAIASCVVGGLSLMGGKGNIFNSVVGTLIMGLILNILQLLGVSSYWQEAITGLVIIAAAGVDVILNRSKD